ncbi:RluA family pseudouridine synthase [Paenibacillus taichungensis]|uniref:Pseudouridine synthase n=1 Tax=Paenibacillus taichungensis TaxID=484184 RepID=A0ABX2MJ37_9BACL|nr:MULTISPECIES: RluA family pseudouridine synthase [Paenibacillus]OME79164.1 RNA pseudouridine synthase [Paenibacillus pabuli]MEC0109382.1 RluA family pseudouridine synthase [Paenibacillus taichungensis]MEC0196407.1 RluA family pseudouridine synthase [Paenibacillus taichungensis]NUU53717.1 RluA family pseudouridine synthase [Paenibacillus taichungensis]PIH57681.1 RluA family pseudouridine synthase [Paenibacillus sp. LK1]
MTIKSWKRRGEWLELMPGKAVTGSSDRQTAAEQWLLSELQLPEKMLRQLKTNQGIQLAGDRLRLALFASQPIDVEPRWADIDVLYEDDFCLVVHKPAGMKLHPDGSRTDQAITLDHAVASYYEMNGVQANVRHVHRLDEDTTGPVLYAKNAFALTKLDEAMRRKDIGRHYVAIAGGKISTELNRIDAPIGKDRHHKQRRRVSEGGQDAVTHVEIVEVWDRATLIRLTLDTGRTHQIRVHLSYVGHPLVGDELYGGRRDSIGRQALHGETLIFSHPLTGARIEVADPWPQDFEQLAQRKGKDQ